MSNTICRSCGEELDDTNNKRGDSIPHCHSYHIVGNKDTILKENNTKFNKINKKSLKGGNNQMAQSKTEVKKALADEIIAFLENKGVIDGEKRKVFSTAYTQISQKMAGK